MYSEIVREPQFYLDSGEFEFGNFYAEATSFILTGKDKQSLEYLLGLFHSKIITFAFMEFYAGGGLGEGYRYKKAFLEKLPIPQITESHKDIADEIIALVDKILESKAKDSNTNTSELESKIDSLVYKLYGLSDDEINLIESK